MDFTQKEDYILVKNIKHQCHDSPVSTVITCWAQALSLPSKVNHGVASV